MKKKIKPQEIPSPLSAVPAIDCTKPAFKHLSTKHGRSFVSLSSKGG